MNKKKTHTFQSILSGVLMLSLAGIGPVAGWANETAAPFDEETGSFYKDVFDQALYEEGINQLDLSRWGRKLFGKKIPSGNINLFDEVPDSSFFVNRHAKAKISLPDLEKGYRENDGPDLSQPLTVLAAEQRNLVCKFLVEDARKDQYLLKFDTQGHLEMTTAAEVIASRFYYALGYHVPQYTILFFKPEQIKAGEGAWIYDNTGFKKALTQKVFEEYLTAIPQMPDGTFRASARKLFKTGEKTEGFSFKARARSEAKDSIHPRDRREIRGLGLFAAWLNNYDVRASIVLERENSENGKPVFQYYLSNFMTALGASSDGSKPPVFGYEHMLDYGETLKSFLALGLREKTWQKAYDEEGDKPAELQAAGYFSNKYFDPSKYKVQLPYDAFRMTTRADGFWAARMILSFSDEDIRAMVRAGAYSEAAVSDLIAKTLIKRRDIIGKYWCLKANPLAQFAWNQGELSFKDLAVEHGFVPKEGTVYHVEISLEHKKKEKSATLQTPEPVIKISNEWLRNDQLTCVTLRTSRPSLKKQSPFVSVFINASGIQKILRED